MSRSLRTVLCVLLTALWLAPATALATDDPFWGQQWALQKMRVSGAWQHSRGAKIVVAIVDTGVDLEHPDLEGRILPGYDFVDDDPDAQDQNGHGTHMAGTVAAVTGNAIGIASVAPDAWILPVRVLDAKGQSDDPQSVANGIRWAVDHGAKVVNLSLAQDGPGAVEELTGELLSERAIDEAIRYVTSKGAVAVVAAGNSDDGGKSKTSYTATSPGAIVVGASTNTDQRAAYSNYGSGLDVLAPGGGSASDPNFDRGCTLANSVVGLYWNPKTKRSDYAGACGTSVAVSHVSGLAAILMARGYTNVQAVQRIERTATDLSPKGKDLHTGWGRVDATRAIGAATSSATPKTTAKPTAQPRGGRVGPAGRTVTGSPPVSPPAILPPQALRPLAKTEDRSLPIAVAAVLALALGMAHAEVRHRRSS